MFEAELGFKHAYHAAVLARENGAAESFVNHNTATARRARWLAQRWPPIGLLDVARYKLATRAGARPYKLTAPV